MRLREIRENQGMARTLLSKLAGVSVRTIEYIEREGKGSRAETLQKLAKALGVAIDELLADPAPGPVSRKNVGEAKNFILSLMGEKGWVYYEDLRTAAGFTRMSLSTLRRAKDGMGLKNRSAHNKGDTVCVWALADTPDDVVRDAVEAGAAAKAAKKKYVAKKIKRSV